MPPSVRLANLPPLREVRLHLRPPRCIEVRLRLGVGSCLPLHFYFLPFSPTTSPSSEFSTEKEIRKESGAEKEELTFSWDPSWSPQLRSPLPLLSPWDRLPKQSWSKWLDRIQYDDWKRFSKSRNNKESHLRSLMELWVAIESINVPNELRRIYWCQTTRAWQYLRNKVDYLDFGSLVLTTERVRLVLIMPAITIPKGRN